MAETYRLTMSLRSPFARRARLALLRLGIPFETEVYDVFKPTPELYSSNPLALVPSLKLKNGTWLPDSSSILEYLSDTHGDIWSKDPQKRVQQRIGSTLAEGIMTATVSYFLETQKKNPDQDYLTEYLDNIRRTLDWLTRQNLEGSPWQESGQLTQPSWDLGVALEYLALRVPEIRLPKSHPSLAALLENCRNSSDFRETAPPA